MLRVFPVDLSARPTFVDTFGAPRPPHGVHEGADIFAPEGTPVYAVDDGRIEHFIGTTGGNQVTLHSDDRTRYVYSHLSAFEGQPRRVLVGELVGRVGRTGNAAHTAAHLHFEIHPLEGEPINPTAALQAAKSGPSLTSASSAATVESGGLDGLVLLYLLWQLSKGLT